MIARLSSRLRFGYFFDRPGLKSLMLFGYQNRRGKGRWRRVQCQTAQQELDSVFGAAAML